MKFLLALMLSASAAQAAPLRIFTDRPQDRIQQALDGFTKTTGVAVEVTVASYADLKTKLKAGESADVLLLKDLATITDAAREGLFIRLNSTHQRIDVDPSMRDPKGLWIALAYRVRTIAFDPANADKKSLVSYEALSRGGFAGHLCMRNSKEYMPTLVAWLISHYGEAQAQAIVEGWKANLAGEFTSGDTASLQAVESGACAVTISNHYYLARLKAADQRFAVELAMSVNSFEGGLHTNGFGGGVVKGSASQAQANAFFGYMLTVEGQKLLTAAPSFEYPANKAVKPDKIVQQFGSFKVSDLNWNEIGANVDKATAILERAGWAR